MNDVQPADTTSSVKLNLVTPEQIAWTEQQPVFGTPSMTRLGAALAAAGLNPLKLEIVDGGETIDFYLARTGAVRGLDKEQTRRRLIAIFRASGFEIGFSELGIVDFDDQTLFGVTLSGPLDEICKYGRIRIDT